MSCSIAPAFDFEACDAAAAPPSDEALPATRALEPRRPSRRAVSSEELKAHLHLVRKTVAGFVRRLPPNVLRDDLVSAGTIGLMDALTKHDGERGPQFEWYARVRIRGAILDELRRQDWLSRRDRVTAAAPGRGSIPPTIVGIDDLREPFSALEGDDGSLAERRSEQVALWRGVEALPARERTIVELHYGCDMGFKEVAERLGVSAPRVSQLHARALGMLRGMLQEPRERGATTAA